MNLECRRCGRSLQKCDCIRRPTVSEKVAEHMAIDEAKKQIRRHESQINADRRRRP